MADVVRHAREQGIPVSTRGSVANSLVAYCTGITTVDPIEHDLLFERFLNPARSTPPDIDLDFCSRRRDEVLNYVRETYGADHVALVATISTMRPKSAVRETGKAFGLDNAAISRLTRLLPGGWHPDPRRRDRRKLPDILKQVDDPTDRQVLSDAYAIVGTPHHLSIHPGGVVITPGRLTDHLPLQWTAKGFLITQFDHNDVEQIGLPKIDLLGIRALTVLADATALVRKHHDAGFTLDQIDEGDPETEQMLRQGDTVGVFQCESTGARRTLRQLKVRSVRDLAVANAFFKPGPATGGMAQAFIRRYRGEEPVHYLHPTLTPILNPTKGVLLFQEQILRVAREIAGLSWEEADHLRRGMSKFQTAEMKAMRERFVAGCLRPEPDGPGFSPTQATTLWAQVEAFAGYGFNQGHATAYADVSYRSAYIKAHWPAEFLAARLVDRGGFHHQAIYIAEAIRLGIRVRPPHINQSGRKFTLTRHEGIPVLWMGLGQVRDLRRTSVAQIMAQRAGRPFADLADLLRRVPLQTKEVRHLIQGGALDGLGDSRAAMLAESVELWRAGGAQQMAFSFTAEQPPPETVEDRLRWESHLLGQPLTDHPLDVAAAHVPPAGYQVVPLQNGADSAGKHCVVRAVRLPGWTGGKGFFVGDRQTYAVAIAAKGLASPTPWQPLALRGRWRVDEWGGSWLQVDGIEVLEQQEGD